MRRRFDPLPPASLLEASPLPHHPESAKDHATDHEAWFDLQTDALSKPKKEKFFKRNTARYAFRR